MDRPLHLAGILVSAAWGALYSAAPAAVMTIATGGDLKDFGKAVLAGAVTGGVAGTLSSVTGSLGNSGYVSLLNNAGTAAGSSAIMGNGVSAKGILSSTVGGFVAGKLIGQYNTRFKSRLSNVLHESAHMGLSGAVSGVASGATWNLLHGRSPLAEGIGRFAGYGALSGTAAGLGKSALIGAPTLPTDDPTVSGRLRLGAKALQDGTDKPVYRSGGLWGRLARRGKLPAGFAGFGRDIIVNEIGPDERKMYLWEHETAHFWQASTDGYNKVIGANAVDQISTLGNYLNIIPGVNLNINPYKRIGSYEWEADFITDRLETYIF